MMENLFDFFFGFSSQLLEYSVHFIFSESNESSDFDTGHGSSDVGTGQEPATTAELSDPNSPILGTRITLQ